MYMDSRSRPQKRPGRENNAEVSNGNLQRAVFFHNKKREGGFFVCTGRDLGESIERGGKATEAWTMFSKKLAKSVLVVDDDQDVLYSMKALLEVAGLDVRIAHDGDGAIKEIENRRYDLLILDVSMPGIDGVALFQTIRSNEHYRDVPVMFTSGYPVWIESDERRREIFKKAEAYLQKPFNIDVFMSTVWRLVAKGMLANGRTLPC
jgi:CheY-like chemotaxis protein